MKHVSILVPDGECSITTIEGTYQILLRVNDWLTEAGEEPMFDVQLVGQSTEVQMKAGRFRIHPDVCFTAVTRTGLILIPSVHGDKARINEENRPLLDWVADQYRRGAAVASMCIGAFLLAGTGLLNGRSCTTHWDFAHEFRQMFPAVNLVEDKIITDENNIYTSGGAYSWLNLILYLVEKYCGRDMAVTCSKGFQVDFQRVSQSPFIIFSGQKDHEDEAVQAAQEYIEKNCHCKITVDELAERLILGRRNLERRFKKATGNTVMEYIQRVKMEAVKKSLETSRLGVNEVMDRVGYTDPKAFRMTFKKVTGLSPLQYRNRYNREYA
ncbi:MAG TPA: helix-turn-helix domain-containing protein [Puia sp.]|uniref:GlxA family transcriptional regulator n=1 Tax=Puia sp. TaxID=2045100 RepID=UPI002BAD7887|nr:helix-turn-helix domain-containing protein [Puia sp.]HVU96284.1 helix-turn-helix domain-containing protein [Puia sp.]